MHYKTLNYGVSGGTVRSVGLIFLMALCLQGCLYGMRQKAAIPYYAIAITGSPSQTFLGQLQVDILTYIDVKVAILPKDADLIVEILQDAPNSQMGSYTGTGQISSFNINDVVVFRALDREGREVIPETQIFGVRDMNFSVSNVLSSDIQQQQFVADIRKELAMQVTMYLMALGRHHR